jgi:hypothetical protein
LLVRRRVSAVVGSAIFLAAIAAAITLPSVVCGAAFALAAVAFLPSLVHGLSPRINMPARV